MAVELQARCAAWWAWALKGIDRREPGQTNVEYALILVLIAVAAAAALITIGQGLGGALNSVNAAFP